MMLPRAREPATRDPASRRLCDPATPRLHRRLNMLRNFRATRMREAGPCSSPGECPLSRPHLVVRRTGTRLMTALAKVSPHIDCSKPTTIQKDMSPNLSWGILQVQVQRHPHAACGMCMCMCMCM